VDGIWQEDVQFRIGKESPLDWMAWSAMRVDLTRHLSPLMVQAGMQDAWLQMWEWVREAQRWKQVAINPVQTDHSAPAVQLVLPPSQRSRALVTCLGRNGPHVISLPPGRELTVLVTTACPFPSDTGPCVLVRAYGAEAEGILEFLRGNAIGALDTLLAPGGEVANRVLQSVPNDPIAAVAAAYYLLRKRDWERLPEQWLINLANHFPWIPDTYLIRDATRIARGMDLTEASALAALSLHQAFSNGLPFFAEANSAMEELLFYAQRVRRPTFLDQKRQSTIAAMLGVCKPAGLTFGFLGSAPDEPLTPLSSYSKTLSGLPWNDRIRAVAREVIDSMSMMAMLAVRARLSFARGRELVSNVLAVTGGAFGRTASSSVPSSSAKTFFLKEIYEPKIETAPTPLPVADGSVARRWRWAFTACALALVAFVIFHFLPHLPQSSQSTSPVLPPQPSCTLNGSCVPNAANTAWVMTSSILSLLMIVPGLALYYAGLARTNNVLLPLMQVFVSVCLACMIWLAYGYSVAFTDGGALNYFSGGLSKAFLRGVSPDSVIETSTAGVVLPEYLFVCFQMMFSAVTPALIIGAMAERVKFSAMVVFVPLWLTFVYLPIVHMVWYWPGPTAIMSAVTALGGSSGDKRAAAETALAAIQARSGLAFGWGFLDFAGGAVVYISSGIAGLTAALYFRRRADFSSELMLPASLPLAMIGASLLWVGRLGLNAGSPLVASGTAALAMVNTLAATSAGALGWIFAEALLKGKPSLFGAISGSMAGLIAVSPVAGYSGPMGAIMLGLVVGVVCLFFCTMVENALGYDNSLDVFGVHCIGGIIGALGTGILVNPALGGTGVFSYFENAVANYDFVAQGLAQIKGVMLTLVWSGFGTAAVLVTVDIVVGLRPSIEEERARDIVDLTGRAHL
jgi:ammonium transporter, Amt family